MHTYTWRSNRNVFRLWGNLVFNCILYMCNCNDFNVRTVQSWKKNQGRAIHASFYSLLWDFKVREGRGHVLYLCRYDTETGVAKPDHAVHARVHSACKSRLLFVPTDRDGKRTCNPRTAGRPPAPGLKFFGRDAAVACYARSFVRIFATIFHHNSRKQLHIISGFRVFFFFVVLSITKTAGGPLSRRESNVARGTRTYTMRTK